ncbi:MAG: hypothetical protein ABI193_21505, partial [Minicystis sp.]
MMTKDVGPCRAALQICNSKGTEYEPCAGEVRPAKEEDCATAEDDDCDGTVNQAAAGCMCMPGSMKECYTGSGATLGVGICRAGMCACNPDGKGCGACVDEIRPAVEDCKKPEDEDCSGTACAQPLWATVFDAGSFSVGGRIATDSAGNTYLHGLFNTSLKFGATTLISSGSNDLYLAKVDALGVPVWAKRFGTGGNDGGGLLGVAPTGDIVIAGNLMSIIDFGGGPLAPSGPPGGSNVFVAKFTSDGTHLWSKRFGMASGESARSMAVDLDGNVIIVGDFAGNLDFGNGTPALIAQGTDIFIAKLASATGLALWSKRFGDPGFQSARSVAVDPGGNIAVAGPFAGTFSFGGNPVSDASG